MEARDFSSDIRELYSRFSEIEAVERRASDALAVAREAGKESELPVQRDGKEVQVKERHLWHEVLSLGMDSAAGAVLARKYPEVFALYTRQNELADQLREFTVRAFGIDYNKLRLTDIVRMFELLQQHHAAHPVKGRTTLRQRLAWLFLGR